MHSETEKREIKNDERREKTAEIRERETKQI